jgi:hypothetical protein
LKGKSDVDRGIYSSHTVKGLSVTIMTISNITEPSLNDLLER